MYVCVCNAITDREVRAAAKAGVASVSELSAKLGVATNCGSCTELAQAILDTHQTRSTPSYELRPADVLGVGRCIPANAI